MFRYIIIKYILYTMVNVVKPKLYVFVCFTYYYNIYMRMYIKRSWKICDAIRHEKLS